MMTKVTASTLIEIKVRLTANPKMELLMNHNLTLLDCNTVPSNRNVACKLSWVKRIVNKFSLCSVGLFVAASLTIPGLARAESPQTRAMLNSTELINFLSGVVPEGLPTILENIQNNTVKRIAPNYPVWIIESEGGNILYYQGQKGFVGQSATRLVDDNGFRFGLRALEMARKSKGTWLNIKLGGAEYKAYCASKAPYVVCSLIL